MAFGRWLSFVAALVFLLKSIFWGASLWSVTGFFATGLAWYWLGWRKARELDSPKPR